MYFALTPQQRALQAALRELLADRQPEEVVRDLMDDPVGDDPELWSALMKVVGPGEPGQATAVQHAVVLEVLGETLFIGPYLSSVVRGGLLLPAAAAGEVRATVVDQPIVYASGLLEGAADAVLDGMTAEQIVVAVDAGGTAFAVVAGGRVTRTPVRCLDQTRKLAELTFTGAPADPVRSAGTLEQLRLVTQAGVAAGQVGCAQAALKAALAYVRERQQFGRAVGSYQGVKHALADVALAVEQARSAAYHAAWTLDARPAEAPTSVAHARIVCTSAALQAAEACMQFRGGQGFRWDNVAHLYLKRAKADQLLFGDPARERERLARLLHLL